jgi:hypothetical protein
VVAAAGWQDKRSTKEFNQTAWVLGGGMGSGKPGEEDWLQKLARAVRLCQAIINN